MAYVGVLGLMQLIHFSGEFTGGRIGRFSVNLLEPALTTPGAFVILVGLTVAGLLIAFDMPLRALLSPATRAARAAGTTLQDRTTRPPDASAPADAKAVDPRTAAAGVGVMAETGRRGKNPRLAPGEAPGQTGVWGGEPEAAPYGLQSPAPTSATIAPLRSPVGVGAATAVATTPAAAGRPSPAGDAVHDPEDVTDASDSPAPRDAIAWVLPPKELLDLSELPTAAAGANADAVHAWNEARIIEKLKSFDIDARITGRNAGPVVTQYEVDARAAHQGQPDRGPVRRPLDGPRGPEHPDRGADPGQERGRDRGAQQGVQRRRPAADPRRGRLRGLGLDAHVRARARRGGQGDGGRPRQDAPPADRGRHRARARA